MIRNLRGLGIAFAAIFAISAMAASAAYATPTHFKTDGAGGTATITVEAHPGAGLNVQSFATDVGQIECEEFHAIGKEGTATSPTATLTQIEYNVCNLGGVNAKVTFAEGCHYTLHSGETVSPGVSTGSADVTETTGKPCEIKIEVKKPQCTVTLKPQNGLTSITYTNVQTTGKKEEITGHANVHNIIYSWAGTACGTGNDTNGVYEGTFTARAYETDDVTPIDLTIEDTP